MTPAATATPVPNSPPAGGIGPRVGLVQIRLVEAAQSKRRYTRAGRSWAHKKTRRQGSGAVALVASYRTASQGVADAAGQAEQVVAVGAIQQLAER